VTLIERNTVRGTGVFLGSITSGRDKLALKSRSKSLLRCLGT
jgi:hypothetical protein